MLTLSNHAIPLVDKDGNERKTDKGGKLLALGVSVKAEPAGENTIRMVASTEDVDRSGDIIRAEGWGLDAYNKNPVILWGHDHDTPAVMEAKKTWVDGTKLLQDWYSDPTYRASNPLANLVWAGYQPGGPLRASSVGFMPQVYRPIEDEEGGTDDFWIAGWSPTEYLKQELYEVSAVNVPANPHALQELRAKGLDTRPLEEMWQHMDGFVIEVKDEQNDSDDPVPDGDETKLTFTSIEEVKEYMEGEGYSFVETDEPDIDLDNIEPEHVLELEPEPEITEEEAEAARQMVTDYFENERKQQKLIRAVRREINLKFGIVED